MPREYRFEQSTTTLALVTYGIGASFIFLITDDEGSNYTDYEDALRRVENWCVNQFGPGGKDGQVWVRQGWTIAIWGDINATAFKLRWC